MKLDNSIHTEQIIWSEKLVCFYFFNLNFSICWNLIFFHLICCQDPEKPGDKPRMQDFEVDLDEYVVHLIPS